MSKIFSLKYQIQKIYKLILFLFLYSQATVEQLNISIHKITMLDYEQHHYDKEKLKQSACHIGNIEVNPVSDLEQVRAIVNKFCEDNPEYPKLSFDWCFVDCKSIKI